MKIKFRIKHPKVGMKVVLCIVCLFALSQSACEEIIIRVPASEPQVADFDASLIDDAGPGASCPEINFDNINNAYSPYFGGEENLDVVVEVIAYFRCPYCAAFAQDIRAIWKEIPDYRARVRIYFHHFPLTGHDANAWEVHAAAKAAQNQGMEYFWLMHDEIFSRVASGRSVTVDVISEYAESIGLDMERFEEDRESEETLSFLVWDKSQAEDLHIRGTPAVFVCGYLLTSQYDLVNAIDDFLTD